MKLHRDYPHLQFKVQWDLDKECWLLMGQAIAYLKAINNTPIIPQYYSELMNVALIKGAQSTTAIEGNTLTDEDISKVKVGGELPESLQYQGVEVTNILRAFDEILIETVYQKRERLITPELLLEFHKLIGRDLGDHFGAIPGRFRDSDVIVGKYRCPDYRDIPVLIDRYCKFLQEIFRFEDHKQKLSDFFIEAIVAHVYLEWIHPFGDGNGRTGRLLEFYVLSRGGNPDITLHILSNHYNLTRPEYYRQLDKASHTGDLSEFIKYALIGYRDGLRLTLEKIQESQIKITWQKYVYDQFGSVDMGHKEVFKRKRTFALEMPLDRRFTFEEIPDLNITLAKLYSNIGDRTVNRDIEELMELKILKKEDNQYYANLSVLNKMIAKRKGLPIEQPVS